MKLNLVDPEVERRYLESLVESSDPVLEEMEREAAQRQFPIIGRAVGRLLETLCLASGARDVFELGSGFGYSAYWLARGVGPSGSVLGTERSTSQVAQARDYLGRAGLADRIRLETGEALPILEREPGPFDLIFCDIDKEQYAQVPALALPRLRRGGLLVFDNALWHGQVADPTSSDAIARMLRELNRQLHTRPELVTTLLPLRDGVSVSVKL